MTVSTPVRADETQTANRRIAVLIAEDDQTLNHLLQKRLRREGVEVRGAGDGREVLDQVEKDPPNLLVLDYRLPDLTAQQVIEILGQRGYRIPFIVMTGYGDERLAVAMMKLGARDYVTKSPHLPELLVSAVRRTAEEIAHEEKLRAAETALWESEEKYRRLVEDLPAFICAFTPEGVLMFVNEEYCRFFNKKKDELIGSDFFHLIPRDNRPAVREHLGSLTVADPTRSMEHPVVAAGGAVRWQRWTDRALFDRENRLLGYQSIGQDITEKRQAEEKLLHYQNQLQALAGRLAETEEKERRRIATWLHDEIGQMLFLAKLRLEEFQSRVTVPNLRTEAGTSAELIEKILDNARNLTLSLAPAALFELGLESALRSLAREYGEKHGLHVEVATDDGPEVEDKDVCTFLYRAGREMLFNVVKHARASGVKILLERGAETIRLEVSDDGIGFDPGASDPDYLPVRGFGLFSLRERANHLGGDFCVQSAPGQGTRVAARVPRTPPGDSTEKPS